MYSKTANINANYTFVTWFHTKIYPDTFYIFSLGLEVLINLTRLNLSYNRICDLSGKIQADLVYKK